MKPAYCVNCGLKLRTLPPPHRCRFCQKPLCSPHLKDCAEAHGRTHGSKVGRR